MQHADYVALHVHSEFSLLDGAIRLRELVDTAVEYKMPAVAVTDHGNLFGAVQFYRAAVKAGIKPILGCEIYVAPGDRTSKERTEDNDAAYHLILLARNNDGYKNLVTLVSKAYLEGFYYKPRIDHDLLEQYSGGLIGLSACLQGEVPFHLRRGNVERAREVALWYKHVLGPENFYLELQANGMPEQDELNKRLIELGRELHIPLAATNDCHYLKKSDAKAHEILLCIQTGKTMNDESRMRFDGEGFYFRSPAEMKEYFSEIPEAVTNTRTIAERCNVEFKMGESLLPRYTPPEGMRPRDYLRKIALEGLHKKFGPEPPEEYVQRFEREFEVIIKMGYPSYFLIVWDFINYAKQNGVPVGPGRGSAAGSLVAYALGITEIDPIKYGLLFERFLNPERVSMPDIDVDFCKDRRGEVLDYVARKYGRDHVAQIITFGTMAARAVIRDVARAMDFPYAEADRLAKLVPEALKMTIKEALKLEPQLKKEYDNDDSIRELLDIGMRLEGLARHASTHAAGVVIAPEPLTDYAPLYKAPNEEAVTTQFDMVGAEQIGLIKFDFLGLKTLTVIEKTITYLRNDGIEVDIANVPLDDRETYEFLSSGKTTGVFQLESDGMKDILVKMQPSRFEDLIALVALYRPGPIKSGMIDDFIKRKKGQKAIEYELPQLKDILDETYGVIIYQEQVMSIANKLANFSMGQADVLRKAMGKKKAEVMAEQKELFVAGATKNGIKADKAERLFDLMAFFAEYGFNKSHSAAYAYISYQTAYLKAHYPVYFMAATLSLDIDNTDKVVKNINECRNLGIEILPPDVNLCGREFTVDGPSIRFGLGAVKGAGQGAVDAIMEAREEGGAFDSFEDYQVRVDSKRINKKVSESLIKAGAFDSLCKNGDSLESLGKWRSALMDKVASSNGAMPSLSLFGDEDPAMVPDAAAWDESELLKNEKEALGFYISGSPLNKYRCVLKTLGISDIKGLEKREDKTEVEVAGMVMAVRKIRTRKGDIMAAVALEDENGAAEAIVFPDLYQEHPELVQKDVPLHILGTLEKSEKGLKIIAKELGHLDDLLEKNGKGRRAIVTVKQNGTSSREALLAFHRLVSTQPGPMPLYLSVQTAGAEALIETSLNVRADEQFIHLVEEIFGPGALTLALNPHK